MLDFAQLKKINVPHIYFFFYIFDSLLSLYHNFIFALLRSKCSVIGQLCKLFTTFLRLFSLTSGTSYLYTRSQPRSSRGEVK